MSLNIFFLVSGPKPSSYRPLTIETPAEPPSRSSSFERSSWSLARSFPLISGAAGFGGCRNGSEDDEVEDTVVVFGEVDDAEIGGEGIDNDDGGAVAELAFDTGDVDTMRSSANGALAPGRD